MKVKICGITNLADALLCESCGADAIGFIFYVGSKRQIMPNEAAEIVKQLNPLTIKVGVFVNENPVLINQLVRDIGLNMVQLHGNETPEEISLINVPVIKAFRVNDNFDFTILHHYSNSYLLLDSYKEEEFGGTGKSFNWQLIPEQLKSKIILAGGINSDNIDLIFRQIKPQAIDVSSSLEQYPGKKDKQKVIQFFNKIKTFQE
ncbi:MAG: phosphoribosylanthranilate isomerase [Ignavibacterium sp.]|uniref:phosphoribosylanthranilate isomerase n=1 Tax=Ignavibacterium sp. TaxID=2651167 RepID=UPI00404A9F47